ncbi:MAG: ascorbate-dependent monooxygenase [Acidobacteria bacterium]|nr:ascorbate-dependent monooxygenase [Acidobacteriota bacterium]MBI3279050.1 ascorbate-dependent monooxygenase [Acidobacteriota bacterium]
MRFFVLAAGVALLAGQSAAQPTFSREVSRIMQAKCQICHRPDDIAPFSLMTYQDAAERLEAIQEAVGQRRMPPWKPVEGHGRFRDSYALSEEERNTILQWIDAGAPEGDPADMPEPPPQTGEWQHGEPDLVVQMPQLYEVPRRSDVYRCFVLPTGLEEDKWVTKVQVMPGNRQIVHHVILFLDSSGQAEELDARDEEPGYECFGGPGFEIAGASLSTLLDLMSSLGGWAPGMRANVMPEGVGLFLSRRARIVMQVHYFPGGRGGTDQTKVGLYFAQEQPQKRMLYVPVLNTTFELVPGEKNQEVNAEFTVPFLLDATAWQIVPHMHLLGRRIKVEVERQRETESLVYIDDWDFDWQSFYTFEEPVDLPAGARIKLACTFDNSSENPRNPSDPPKRVTWGEGTQDEMCIAFLGVTLKNQFLLGLLPMLAVH